MPVIKAILVGVAGIAERVVMGVVHRGELIDAQ
jgi:hypothetical protein